MPLPMRMSLQIKQLEMCGKLYDGQERSAEELLAGGPEVQLLCCAKYMECAWPQWSRRCTN